MQQLSDSIQKVIERLETQHGKVAKEIAQNWVRIVGSRCARHCAPADVRGNTLIVNVDNSAWMYMLRLRQPQMLKKLECVNKRIQSVMLRIGKIS
jgi:predicted nucleic acid-binding Zn ribbon protein